MCVCVCVCMYVYMCVCVCVDRIRNFSLLDLFPISLVYLSLGYKVVQVTPFDLSLGGFYFFLSKVIRNFSCCLCYGHWMCVTPIPKAKLIESSYLSCTGVDSWWGKCSPTNQ